MAKLSKFLKKTALGTAINNVVGSAVVGVGTALHSEPLGGYLDPNNVDGYTYNPDDGGWYLSPPAPDLGQWVWREPADPQKKQELDINRKFRQQHNDIEQLRPDQKINTDPGIPWIVTGFFWDALHLIFLIKYVQNSYNEAQIPKIYLSIKRNYSLYFAVNINLFQL